MNKRGTAAVLAMIFLVIFAALSAAFYSLVNISVTVGKNDRNSVRARAAAESGMEYVKHSLAMVKLKGSAPNTQVIGTMYAAFHDMLGTSPDVASGSVDYLSTDKIALPVLYLYPPNPVTKSSVQSFASSIEALPVVNGVMNLRVKVEGQDTQSKLRRYINADFRSVPAGRNVFEFDLASAGVIKMSNASLTCSGAYGRANVLSASDATPSIYIENSQITGQLGVVLTEDQVDADDRGKISVNGTSDPTKIIKEVNLADTPSIPEFTPNVFKELFNLSALDPATLGGPGDSLIYTNRIVSGNARGQTRFPSGTVINGILFIEPPNEVVFTGSVILNGIIVYGTGLKRDGTPYGPNECSITMSGSYDFRQDITAIPTEPANLATAIQGYTILAPNARVNVGGSADVYAEGSIVCYSFEATNSGVTVNVNNGTLLTLSPENPSVLLEQGAITFTRTRPLDPPDYGVSYFRHYVLVPETYEEIIQ